MKEKKHIDQLFKEGLKNFEASPPTHVWGAIEAALRKKKKDRRIIPLWIKLGGIAALIALLFSIGNTFFNNHNHQISPRITEENKPQKSNNLPTINSNNKSIIATEGEKNSSEKTKDNNHNNTLFDEVIVNSSDAKKTRTATNKIQKTTSSKERNHIIKQIISTPTQETSITQENHEKRSKENNNSTILENKEHTIINDLAITNSQKIKNKSDIAQNNNNGQEEKNEEIENNKPSILDVIEEQKTSEDAVATSKNKIGNRWELSPNFAPVFYNTLSQGSSIDPSFADNPQNSDVNFSYGIQVSYSLSNKFSVRTGINTVNLSYTTKGIELGTGPVAVALKSVNYGNQELVLTAFDQGTLTATEDNGDYNNITPKSTTGDVSLSQKINYYEVPLEINYSLLNKKLGLSIIGGLSTLFLGNNEIYVEAGNLKSTLGEANNLSSISFSTNLGLGVHYNLSKKFKFNIEPMFKYQLNPYTDSSVNYKPYYLGVYTGLSFKF
ncbi:MAG: outer membrane beta-barrel protein [Flavobacteriales bacterium]